MVMYDPRGLYRLAEEIKDDERYEKESRYRTAINRLYYSLFLMVLQMYLNEGNSVKDPNRIHKEVREWFQGEYSRAGNKLEMLHKEFRVLADYYLDERVDEKMTNDAFRLAEYIYKFLEEKGL